MFTLTYKSTKHLEKHYSLEFLRDYYGEDESSMRTILRMYLDETPGELQQIEAALNANDAAAAKAATHKMKNNVAMLGITDPAGFLNAMHLHAADAGVNEELVTLFRLFKSEVLRGISDMEKDFFL